MKSFTKKILLLVFVFLTVFLLKPIVNVKASETIQNVSINNDGTMSWNEFDNAKKYWLGVNGNSSITSDNPTNVIDYINNYCLTSNTCENNNVGTYQITLEAYNEDSSELLATWKGNVTYDGEQITESIGVYKLTIKTNNPNCKVEFDKTLYEDGSVLEFNEGEEVRLFAKAAAGYSFVNATSTDTEVEENGSIGRIITMPNKNAVITFNFLEGYVVTFNTNGGNNIDNQVVQSNEKVTKPDNPKKDNYVFVDWYLDSTLTTKFDFETEVTANITLYAKWNVAISNVVITGVTKPSVGIQPTINGIETSNENVEINTSNTFWMYKNNNDSEWNAFNGDTFEEGKIYGIRIMLNAKEGYDFSENVSVTVNGNSANDVLPWGVENKDRAINYSFGTLEEVEKVTLTIDVNGGNELNPNVFEVEKGKTLGELFESLNIPEPTHSNNTVSFLGLYNSKENGNVYDMNFVVNSDLTVYYHWSEASTVIHTVTLDLGITNTDADLSEVNVQDGENMPKPVDPSRDGYTFGGWYEDNTFVQLFDFENTAITSNTRIYAKWIENDPLDESSTLTFDVDGGTPIEAITKDNGEKINLPTPVKEGYNFIEWYTVDSENNPVSEYEADEEFEFNGEDVTLHALWEVISYTVTLDYNGGRLSGETSETQEVNYNEKALEPVVSPIRNGYLFIGWSKDNTIINEDTGAQNGEYYDFDTEVKSDINLVANWIKLYNVSYNTGDVMNNPNAVQVPAGHTPEYPVPNIVRYEVGDYRVDSFYLDSEFTIPFDFDTEITKDTIIYVKWVLKDDDDEMKLIEEINLQFTNPLVGDETTTPADGDDWAWENQTNQANITVSNDAKYSLDGEQYMNWFNYVDEDFDIIEPFIGTFEEGKEYNAVVYIMSDDGYYFNEDTIIKVNGTKNGKIEYVSNSTGQDDFASFLVVHVKVKAEKEQVTYKILDGANQKIDTSEDLVIRADGDISDFVGLKIDLEAVESKNYELKSGSTIITIKSSYLKTLQAGNHTLTVLYNNGSVSTNFMINETTSTTNNPQTSDNIYIWTILLVISSFGMIFSLKLFKKFN